MGAKVWTPEETELLFSIRDSATVRQILEQGQDGDKAPRGYLRQAAEAMVRELHPALKKLPIFQGDDVVGLTHRIEVRRPGYSYPYATLR